MLSVFYFWLFLMGLLALIFGGCWLFEKIWNRFGRIIGVIYASLLSLVILEAFVMGSTHLL